MQPTQSIFFYIYILSGGGEDSTGRLRWKHQKMPFDLKAIATHKIYGKECTNTDHLNVNKQPSSGSFF